MHPVCTLLRGLVCNHHHLGSESERVLSSSTTSTLKVIALTDTDKRRRLTTLHVGNSNRISRVQGRGEDKIHSRLTTMISQRCKDYVTASPIRSSRFDVMSFLRQQGSPGPGAQREFECGFSDGLSPPPFIRPSSVFSSTHSREICLEIRPLLMRDKARNPPPKIHYKIRPSGAKDPLQTPSRPQGKSTLCPLSRESRHMIPEHSPTPHAHHMLRHRIQAVTGDFCDEMLTQSMVPA